MVSSESAPAAGWATTTCPPGPLSMLRGSSTVASLRCTRPRPSPTTTTCASVSAVARASGSRPAGARRAGERRQRGEAEAEEGAAVEVHARHYGAARRAGPPRRAPLSEGRARARWRRRAAARRGAPRRPGAPRPPPRWPTAPPSPRARGAARPRRTRSPPGTVRSSTPSETRTTSSSPAIVACAGSRGGSSRSSPSTGPSPPLQRAQPALGVPDHRRRVPAAQPRQRRRGGVPRCEQGAHEDLADLECADRLVDVGGRVGQVAAAAARRAIGAQRDRPDGRGLRSLAHRVGHAEPAAVHHRAVVDPVAADVVGGEDRAGHLGPFEMRDPRRQQVLLELGGRAALAVPAGAGQHVGVALGELEGRRAARREGGEVSRRRPGEDEHAERAPAQRQRQHRGRRGSRAPARRPARLGSPGRRAARSRAVSGSASSPATRCSERPSRSATYSAAGAPAAACASDDQPLGDLRDQRALEQLERIARHGGRYPRACAAPRPRPRGGSGRRARPRRPWPRDPWARRAARAEGRARRAARR